MRSIFFLIILKSYNLFAGITTTCNIDTVESYGQMGDTSGKNFFTKKNFNYKCETVVTDYICEEMGTVVVNSTNTSMMQNPKVYYEEEDFSGTMGEIFSTIKSFDKINGLWSGWHGICQKGKDDGNWDWLSDPYTIASYALTVYSAGATKSLENAQKAAEVEQTIDATSDAAQVANASANVAKMSKQFADMVMCAAQTGIDTARIVTEYVQDGEPCDPVDEFCDGEDSNSNDSDDSNYFSLSQSQYDDLVTKDPSMLDYIEIISTDNGVLTIKVVNNGATDNLPGMDAAQDAIDELKKKILIVRATLAAAQSYACFAAAASGSATATATSSNGDATSEEAVAETAVVMAVGQWNPLVGMALDMALNTFDSVQSIDTCGNKDDAKNKGQRHEATYHAKRLGMCHLVEVKRTGSDLTMNKRTKYRYCCYDSAMTRALVEQAKAQFAKDWQHCTDMTVAELTSMSFNYCDTEELDNSVDGVLLDPYAPLETRLTAYQHTHSCIDPRGYEKAMFDLFGGDDMLIDTDDIKEALKNYQ